MFNFYSPAESSSRPAVDFLQQAGLGFGSLALASMLHGETACSCGGHDPLALPAAPFSGQGEVDHLAVHDGGAVAGRYLGLQAGTAEATTARNWPDPIPATGFFTTSGKCLKSPFEWAQHGESGSWVSDLFPHLSKHVDKMCFLHSMYLKQNNHAPASIELMCGTNRPGLPALGAWMTYGLGSQNQNLPVVCRAARHATARRRSDLVGRLSAQDVSGTDARCTAQGIDRQPGSGRQTLRRATAFAARSDPRTESEARDQPPHAGRSGSADQLVRTRLPHADGGPRSARPVERVGSNAQAVRHGPPGVRNVFAAVPARAAAGRTRRAIRADLCGQGRRTVTAA